MFACMLSSSSDDVYIVTRGCTLFWDYFFSTSFFGFGLFSFEDSSTDFITDYFLFSGLFCLVYFSRFIPFFFKRLSTELLKTLSGIAYRRVPYLVVL